MGVIVAYALLVSPDYGVVLQIASLRQTQSELEIELWSLSDRRKKVHAQRVTSRKGCDRLRPVAERRERADLDLVTRQVESADDAVQVAVENAKVSLRRAAQAIERVQAPSSNDRRNDVAERLQTAKLCVLETRVSLHRGRVCAALVAELAGTAAKVMAEVEQNIRKRSQLL